MQTSEKLSLNTYTLKKLQIPPPFLHKLLSPLHFPPPFYRPSLLLHSFPAVLRRRRRRLTSDHFPAKSPYCSVLPSALRRRLLTYRQFSGGREQFGGVLWVVLVRWCRCPSTRNELESGKGRVFAVSGLENLVPLEKCLIRNPSVNLPWLRSARSNHSKPRLCYDNHELEAEAEELQ